MRNPYPHGVTRSDADSYADFIAGVRRGLRYPDTSDITNAAFLDAILYDPSSMWTSNGPLVHFAAYVAPDEHLDDIGD